VSLPQRFCFTYITCFPLFCLPLWCLAIIPQICLLSGVSLYPKVTTKSIYVLCLMNFFLILILHKQLI
jgi:hypothetical protein